MVFLLTVMVCSEVYKMLQDDKIDYSRGLKALLEKKPSSTLNEFGCVDRQPVKPIFSMWPCFCLALCVLASILLGVYTFYGFVFQ